MCVAHPSPLICGLPQLNNQLLIPLGNWFYFCPFLGGSMPSSATQLRGLERHGHRLKPILKFKNCFQSEPYSKLAQTTN